MSDIIKLLPDSVANQIAAGEVIQRPSSAIKELVENAVDAGANSIKVIIKDAGKTMIQVIDNGVGMSETDARMAFERHATSKISRADDLFTLNTMGFRGEALPSICAISEVEVKTRQAESQLGTNLTIAGSKVMKQEACICDKGTIITVKKLFYNVPARRKFLKSDNVELSNIMREFERMALVNNNLHMSINTGAKIIDLRAGSFKQRIVDLWKGSLEKELIPVDVDTSLIKIEGFISRPEYARRRNPLQFLITNGRNMRHPYFRKAILGCYDSLIAPNTEPCYFLKFTVDPQSIDVNRSPTKDEIKFEYEQQIWPILQAAVKGSLGKNSAVPSIDFTSDAIPVSPLREGEFPEKPEIAVPPNYNPFKTHNDHANMITNWDSLYEKFTSSSNKIEASCDNFQTIKGKNIKSDLSIEASSESLFEESLADSVHPLCIQYANKYIITSNREGVLVIDQHRAHVRILFDDYLKKIETVGMVSQRILFPEVLELDDSQSLALFEIDEELKKIGFLIEYESDLKWRIQAVPSVITSGSAADIILRVLDSVNEDSVNYGADGRNSINLKTKIALMMARSSAIRRGQRLTISEMEHLIAELFSLQSSSLTPNGNPIYKILEESKINSLFQ